MAKALYGMTDGDKFEGIVWETKIGKVITFKGNINPQAKFLIRDCETQEDLVNEDMIDVLIEILPQKLKDVMKGTK